MATAATYLNVTLIMPKLDKTLFWADSRSAFLSVVTAILNNSLKDILYIIVFYCFAYSELWDIFDVDYPIESLRDEVCILKEMPPRLKRRVEQGYLCSLPPCSSSNISYYNIQVSFHLSISHDVSKSYACPGKDCIGSNWENRFYK